jgi:CRISPR system Cascade subunit CasA
MSLLFQELIRVRLVDEAATSLTLPGTFAALMADRIAGFPALRPHQRHAWHAFLTQLGAVALHAAGLADPPRDEAAWRDLLLRLTPGEAAETAWSLVAPPDRPALLQPPLPDGLAALKNAIATPDGLDMLVTAKNHDLKQAVMAEALPDDWLFALVTLQTMEGFLGAGNYGISRMNGGFASRPALGLVPAGGSGAQVRRDLLRLLCLRETIASQNGYATDGGLALVWLEPWNGVAQLELASLDPLYIEICRRVRLVATNDILSARAGSSKAARIVPSPGGVTGDPWAPLRIDKDGKPKVLTTDASGFGYCRMVDLLFPGEGNRPSGLQEAAGTDAAEGLALLARALVRGQGKTEGYHERRVPLSRRVPYLIGSRATDHVAEVAHLRVELAGELQRRVLRPALLSLFQNGPDRIDLRHDASSRKAERFLARFDRHVDGTFFDDLWTELEQDTEEARHACRSAWVQGLLAVAGQLVIEADTAAPKSAHRRYRARVRALDELHGAARRNQHLRPYLGENRNEHAA